MVPEGIVKRLLGLLAIPLGFTLAAPATPAAIAATTCTATGPHGSCGPYAYAPITDNFHNTFVNLNGWNCGSKPGCGPLSETVTGPGHFTVRANEPTGNTGVMMYPSLYQVWWSSKRGGDVNWPISRMTSFESSFAQTMPVNAKTIAWAAYDMFFNHNSTRYNEMMVQVDNEHGCISCSAFAGRATFGGQRWVLHTYGGEMIWNLVGNPAETTGTVDLLSMMKWLVAHGLLDHGTTFNSIGFGWEVCSTGGVSENFKVSNFSMKLAGPGV